MVLDCINSNLGDKSSASAVTGADAFAKIATLSKKDMQKIDVYVPQNGSLSVEETTIFGANSEYRMCFLYFYRSGREGLYILLFSDNTIVVPLLSATYITITQGTGRDIVISNSDPSYNAPARIFQSGPIS